MPQKKNFHVFSNKGQSNKKKSKPAKLHKTKTNNKSRSKPGLVITKKKPVRPPRGVSQVRVGEGFPADVVKDPGHGCFYIDEETLDSFLYVKQLGWIQISGWTPDVGEGPPNEENPPEPMSGDQYIDVLSGDFYYFADGFGWILFIGRQGPRGPPGSSGFAEIFSCRFKEKRVELSEEVTLHMESPSFQDPDYQLLEDNKILVRNNRRCEIRYLINFKINAKVVNGSNFKYYVKRNDEVILESQIYAHYISSCDRMTSQTQFVIALDPESEIHLTCYAQREKGAGDGCIILEKDAASTLSIICLS